MAYLTRNALGFGAEVVLWRDLALVSEDGFTLQPARAVHGSAFVSLLIADGAPRTQSFGGVETHMVFAAGEWVRHSAGASAVFDAVVSAVDTIPGGTTTTSTLTIGGAAVSSEIDTAGDQDWFRIELVAG